MDISQYGHKPLFHYRHTIINRHRHPGVCLRPPADTQSLDVHLWDFGGVPTEEHCPSHVSPEPLQKQEILGTKTPPYYPRFQENPYVMRKDNYQDFQGNDQYEGFCVDMLRELADILKFSFKIKLVDDGLYGAPEPNGSWTGMVGELINRVSAFSPPPPPSSFLSVS